MGLFEHWPYTNFHDLNMDWIISKVKDLQQSVDNFTPKMQEYVNNWLQAHPEATTTVQDGSLTASKFSTQLTLEAIKDYVTPEMFGAAGDGVTDDTAAFRDALSAGKPVLLISTYLLNGRINLPSDTYLFGSHGASLVWAVNSDATLTSLLYNSSGSNINIVGVSFDFGAQAVARHSISLMDIDGIVIKDCSFTGGYGYMFRLNSSRNIIISNCRFEEITGVTGNPGGAIYGSGMYNMMVNNCTCIDIDDHFVYLNGGDASVHDVVITDNIVDKCGRGALTNGAAVTVYADCTRVSVVNNVLKNCLEGVYGGVYGSYETLPAFINISGNMIYNSGLNGITFIGISTSVKCSALDITGNTLNDCGQDGIVMRYVNACKIDNNSISNVVRRAIEASWATYCSIRNNNLTDNLNGVIIGQSDSAANTTLYNLIAGNIIYHSSAGTTGLNNRRGNYNSFINNYISGYSSNNTGGIGNISINTNGVTNSEQRSIMFTTDITAAVYHNVGDIVINASPSSGAVAWICTAAGAPGTMTPFASI